MGENYKITYNFRLSSDKPNIKELALEYWKNRKFECDLKHNDISGKRGSTWGNLTSFDMTKLLCKLHVEFKNKHKVRAELYVNGRYQDITEVNLWAFKLELILFHKTLNELPFPDIMNEYKKYRKGAAFNYFFISPESGRTLSAELYKKIQILTAGEKLPVVTIEM